MIKILLVLTLFFIGCEDKTYTKIYQKSLVGSHIKDISIASSDKDIRNLSKKALKESGFNLKSSSPYSIDIEYRKYSHHCNNPQTAAYDATYDGFVKLHLFKGLKEVYSVQKDFHGEFDEGVIANLLDKMREDLDLKDD
jgi:hypothetical protein